MPLFIKEIGNFTHGLITAIEDRSIPPDAASKNTNWLTRADRVELRLGTAVVGQANNAAGSCGKVWTAYKIDGTQILFRQRGQSVEYYTDSTNLWTEVGSNILGANGLTENITFDNYSSLAGAQVWFGSPNTGIWKLFTANPGTALAMFLSGTNYYGYIAIMDARMVLWQKNDNQNRRDPTTLWLSKIDTGTYHQVSAEAFTQSADSSRVHFTKTLAQATGYQTVFALAVKRDGVIVATDQGDGTLTGAGGSGTINYITGALDFTYNVAPISTAVTDYEWENSNVGGISDFGFTTPTRKAGEGLFLLQPLGGPLMKVEVYNGSLYCRHRKSDYVVTLSADDTNALNVVFREKGGIPSTTASVATADGMWYVDDVDEQKPKVRLLTYRPISALVLPQSMSDSLDLSNFLFDKAEVVEAGHLILVFCREQDFTYNQTCFVWNKIYRVWDQLDLFAASACLYNGALMLGDTVQQNVFQAFTGFDDDDNVISNRYETGWDSDVGTSLGASRTHRIYPGTLKRVKFLEVEGYIGPNQTINFYMALDDGKFGSIIGSVTGQGDNVDKSQSVDIGATTVGRFEVGGGSHTGPVPASHFLAQFKLSQDKYEIKKLAWEATGLGYAAISKFRWRDIRIMGQRLNRRYRAPVT